MDSRGATPSTPGKFLGCFGLFSDAQFLVNPLLVRCERARQYFLCIRSFPFCRVSPSCSAKLAAPLSRRGADLTCLLAANGYPPPPNLTVTWLEQFCVPAL